MFSSGSLFSKDDLRQIVDRGSDPVVVHQQIERFTTGFPFAELVEPATLKRGIKLFNEEEKAELIAWFDRQRKSQKICRFVPASGAATRMFKSLFALSDALKGKRAAEQEELSGTMMKPEPFSIPFPIIPFIMTCHSRGTNHPSKYSTDYYWKRG